MRAILRIVLSIINALSFTLVFLFGTTGLIYELFGPAIYEKILIKFKIPYSFEYVWLFMLICLVICIVTYILRKKL